MGSSSMLKTGLENPLLVRDFPLTNAGKTLQDSRWQVHDEQLLER